MGMSDSPATAHYTSINTSLLLFIRSNDEEKVVVVMLKSSLRLLEFLKDKVKILDVNTMQENNMKYPRHVVNYSSRVDL